MKPFSERNPVRIATLGLTLLTVIFLLAINFQRLPLVGGGDTYRAAFTDASGLVPGEEVRVAGIKVGAVTGIELEGAHVVVEFRIKGLKLGRETTAQIEVKTLLGQHYLSLTPDGKDVMAEGDQIPLSRTSTPLNIVPAFQRLSSTTDRIDTDQVAAAFDALSKLLDTTAPEVRRTLRGLSRLSHSVSSRDEQIQQLFAQANTVSGVVAARDEELAQLISSSSTVLEVLDARRETIRHIIAGTRSLSGQLVGLVKDNEAQLGPALDKLGKVLEILKANEKQIDDVITYASIYGREFNNVGGTGHWFDATVKVPRNFAACRVGPSNAISGLLDGIFSQINEALNGSTAPCLPLGSSTGGTP